MSLSAGFAGIGFGFGTSARTTVSLIVSMAARSPGMSASSSSR